MSASSTHHNMAGQKKADGSKNLDWNEPNVTVWGSALKELPAFQKKVNAIDHCVTLADN